MPPHTRAGQMVKLSKPYNAVHGLAQKLKHTSGRRVEVSQSNSNVVESAHSHYFGIVLQRTKSASRLAIDSETVESAPSVFWRDRGVKQQNSVEAGCHVDMRSVLGRETLDNREDQRHNQICDSGKFHLKKIGGGRLRHFAWRHGRITLEANP